MSRHSFLLSVRIPLVLLLASLVACAGTSGRDLEGMPDGINDSFLSDDMDVDKYVGMFEGESRAVFAEREAIVASLGLQPGD